jgi:hypothetical protein
MDENPAHACGGSSTGVQLQGGTTVPGVDIATGGSALTAPSQRVASETATAAEAAAAAAAAEDDQERAAAAGVIYAAPLGQMPYQGIAVAVGAHTRPMC